MLNGLVALFRRFACRVFGALGVLPGEAAPMGFSRISCRTAWRSPRAAFRISPPGAHLLARGRPPVRRGRRSAIGGCRIPGRACARAFSDGPAVARLHRRANMSRRPKITRVLDEMIPFLEGAALGGRRGRSLLRAQGFREHPRPCSSIAPSALDRSLAVGRHGLPLIGTRRLERRHEPRSAKRAKGRASGSRGSCNAAADEFPRRWRRRARRDGRA